jgi:hypothetical protein
VLLNSLLTEYWSWCQAYLETKVRIEEREKECHQGGRNERKLKTMKNGMQRCEK